MTHWLQFLGAFLIVIGLMIVASFIQDEIDRRKQR